ncbi:MAG: accessory gene regulator B family protein [Clostridium sp.]|nr:accessory gene regulator B family protein [Clostridium sp.]
MIVRLSKRMASFFVRQKIIEKNDEEVYEYGLQLLLSTVLNAVIALLLAISSGTVIPCLFYLSVFVVMRKSAGGFHAKTHFGCCCILIAVLCCFIAFIRLAPTEIYVIVSELSLIISAVTVLLFAPLEHENKPLSDKDKVRLRKISIAYMAVISGSVMLFGMLNLRQIMVSTALGVLTSSGSVLTAKIQQKFK